MKCLACGSSEAEAAMSRCPRCGFPLIHTVGETGDGEAALGKMAEEYRRKKLSGFSFGLLTYRHEMREGRLEQSSVQEVTLPVRAFELSPGKIFWQEGRFARIRGGEGVTLTLVIRKDGTRREIPLPVRAPETEGFWQTGLVLEPGFAVRLAVGDETSYSCSGEVPLLPPARPEGGE
ncbi:MAG: hypothetical protein HFI65_08285 [Lachnospiraceae bacterium]|nr:hypothetical protein [Lachnospiraceae bacterium]